jgi:peptidoglycan hydrolase-like protein with peptidoglycan-binding domain
LKHSKSNDDTLIGDITVRIFYFTLVSIYLSITAVSAESFDVRQAQMMLNKIGYNAGLVDGILGKNTNRAMQDFMAGIGKSYDGSIDIGEVTLLAEASGTVLPEAPDGPYRLRDAWAAQENLPLYYSAAGGIWTGTQNCYFHFNKSDWQERAATCYISAVFDGHIQEKVNLDFTGDGIRDKIIIGVVNAENERSTHENYQEITDKDVSDNGRCIGGKGKCIITSQMPIFLEGKANGTFVLRKDLLIDNTGEQGQNYYHQIVPADFNGDGTLDIYITGHGVDQHPHYQGDTGSYFLSQPNGTWLESTETHMLHRGRVWTAFNHGVTAGDIDGDGDIDIIETMIENTKTDGLWCRFNDGSGNMKMKACGGGKDGWGVQAGDVDGDGCLDVVQSGGDGHWNGVSWGNCKGRFKKSKKSKFDPRRFRNDDDPRAYGDVLETWLWDLDNDGDLDIVAGHVGQALYVGAALSIHENLGNRTFKEVSFIEFNKRPDTAAEVKQCHKSGEGNPCSPYLKWVDFTDVDVDGLYEIVMASHAAHNNRV